MESYSVLMSVYYKDSPDELRQSIDSMLGQTAICNQFVIVEDGLVSNDLNKLIEEYKRLHPNLFTVVKLHKNGGLGNALNEGLKHCRNELIARMDADDISFPDRCMKELQKFDENPDLCIVGTQINEFENSINNVVSVRRVPCDYESIRKFARRRSPFNHPTVMYKKSVIEKLGGYPTLNRKEDLWLFIQAVNSNCYCENLREPLLYYRTSAQNKKRRKTWTNCKEYIQVMFHFYKKGFLGLNDLIYVFMGQMVLFLMPNNVSSWLSNRLLRD